MYAFPTHDIGPLVGEQREVAPRLYPARHCRADHGFRGGAHDQRFFQLGFGIGNQSALAVTDQAVMRDDRHFLGKALDVFGLLGEIGQRNEQRKIAVLDACRLYPVVHQALNALPDAIPPGLDDHAAAHAGFFGHLGFGNDFLIPLGKISVSRRGEGVFDGGHSSGLSRLVWILVRWARGCALFVERVKPLLHGFHLLAQGIDVIILPGFRLA